MKIPDIATPVFYGLNKIFVYTLLQLRQTVLILLCVFRGKKVSVNYFESLQQAAIHQVPLCLYWEAHHYYKVTINGINVTFNKTPVLQSAKYTGKFILVAYGIFSKELMEINLEVKENYSEKKYSPFKLNYSQHTSKAYHQIESNLITLPSIAFCPKGYEIKFSSAKQHKINFKEEQIIDGELLMALRNANTKHQAQEIILE